MNEVDLFVIGGGSGGVRAARIAASHGARVRFAVYAASRRAISVSLLAISVAQSKVGVGTVQP